MNEPSLAARGAALSAAFDRAAPVYDHLVGLNPGYHRHLRLSAGRLVHAARAGHPEGAPLRVLDLCCGTGASTAAVLAVAPDAEVTALDASEGMLEVARRKGLRARFVHGDAMDPAGSPGVEGPFDAVLMAYGIRNVPDADRCLERLRQLLAPGAPVAFHEYSVRDSLRARLVWSAVTLGFVVPSGAVASRDASLYRYLHASVLAFDGVRAFEARLSRAGFEQVQTLPMDGWQRDVVHTFLARAPFRAAPETDR